MEYIAAVRAYKYKFLGSTGGQVNFQTGKRRPVQWFPSSARDICASYLQYGNCVGKWKMECPRVFTHHKVTGNVFLDMSESPQQGEQNSSL